MRDAAFEKSIQKVFRKSGWTFKTNFVATFLVQREIFLLHVLMGPDIFDLRFPLVDSIYTKKLHEIRDSTPWPNVLVVVRDRDTLPVYARIKTENVAVLHHTDLQALDGLDVKRLIAARPADEDLRWAVQLAEANANLCRQLAQRAGIIGTPEDALRWAEAAVAAKPRDPLAQNDLAGRHLALGNLPAAATAVANALALLPDSAIILSRASGIASRQGRRADALALAQKAVAAQDRRAVDYHHLARLCLKTDTELAYNAARQALILDPENQHFVKTLQEIQNGR